MDEFEKGVLALIGFIAFIILCFWGIIFYILLNVDWNEIASHVGGIVASFKEGYNDK